MFQYSKFVVEFELQPGEEGAKALQFVKQLEVEGRLALVGIGLSLRLLMMPLKDEDE